MFRLLKSDHLSKRQYVKIFHFHKFPNCQIDKLSSSSFTKHLFVSIFFHLVILTNFPTPTTKQTFCKHLFRLSRGDFFVKKTICKIFPVVVVIPNTCSLPANYCQIDNQTPFRLSYCQTNICFVVVVVILTNKHLFYIISHNLSKRQYVKYW